MKGVKLGILGILVFIMAAAPAMGLGLGYEYLENNTLLLAPGANYYFKLFVQNEAPEEIRVNISMESDIATIVGGGIVTVGAQTFNNFVYFNITMPSEAKHGDIYHVPYTVMPMPSGEGQVPMSVRYERVVKVMAYAPGMESVEPTDLEDVLQEERFDWVVLVLILIIIVLLVLLVLKSRKKK